ncbi:Disease resistance protein [Quillaja saponaria]|uniref:Disease resistance protein n=1 Tax=Quillaja saponaria TaxID=32244 RepID=A0AAD7PV39_QUISA|nr:Disease resistance protein [Quillaja saponaria]
MAGTKASSTVRETLQLSSTVISPGVLSNLPWLTELSIDVYPEDHRWDTNVEVIVKEICQLTRLGTLELYIPQVNHLGPLIQFMRRLSPKSLSFKLVVGHHMKRIISCVPLEVEAEFLKWDKCLKFVKGVDILDEVKAALKCATALYLDRHVTVTRLSKFFGIENTTKLKFCIVAECHEMETIVDGEEIYEEGVGPIYNGYKENKDISDKEYPSFGSLQCLEIHYMKNLRCIWKGPIHEGCLHYLKLLALHTCPELETIFTLGMLSKLFYLEELIVKDCPKVNSLVSDEPLDPQPEINLPNLKKISLLHLLNLLSISRGLCIGPQLQKIGFYNCPKLKSLSTPELSSNKLKMIKGEKKWWETLTWSETEWGHQKHKQDYLHSIFSPVNREDDIMTQL